MISLLIGIALAMSADKAASYPLADVFRIFEQSCDGLADQQAHETRLTALGWARYVPEPNSPMDRVMTTVVNVAGPELAKEGAKPSLPRTYQLVAAGRTLELMLMRADVDGGYVQGCRLWDFEAEVESASTRIQALKSEKVSRLLVDDGFALADWPRAAEIGPQGLQVVYIPRSHSVAKAVKAHGLNFKVAHIGIDQ